MLGQLLSAEYYIRVFSIAINEYFSVYLENNKILSRRNCKSRHCFTVVEKPSVSILYIFINILKKIFISRRVSKLRIRCSYLILRWHSIKTWPIQTLVLMANLHLLWTHRGHKLEEIQFVNSTISIHNKVQKTRINYRHNMSKIEIRR